MNLENKHICFVCAYAAPYGGNFIKMLSSLSATLIDKFHCKVFYIFPQQSEKSWLIDLGKEYTIGYTLAPYEVCHDEIRKLIDEWQLDLIHTHFEAYDISVAKAVKSVERDIKMVWHLHDYMSLDKTGLSLPRIRKFFSNQKFWNHYGKWGRKAYFVGVSAEVTNFATHYRDHRFTYPHVKSNEELEQLSFDRAEVIINGIDLDRLNGREEYFPPKGGVFRFLTFGGESISKGIPCIFNAAERIAKKNSNFEIYLTKGYSTEEVVKNIYREDLPSWLKVIPQTHDIASLFGQCHCFISASLRETMSMAIAEASVFGLPVIQSDIPGTWWNVSNPSTFVFPVNDSAQLATQMERIMQFDGIKLLNLCHETATKNIALLNLNSWVLKIVNIYQKL